MLPTTAEQNRRDRLRARIDRLARNMVSISGLMVFLALMMIFAYLLSAVWPLFSPASLGTPQQISLPDQQRSWALGLNNQQSVAYRITDAGEGQFIRLQPTSTAMAGQLISQQLLLTAPTHIAQQGNSTLLANAQGQVVVASVNINSNHPSWLWPLGQQPQWLDPLRQPLRQIALTSTADQGYLLAAVTTDNRLLIAQAQPGQAWRVQSLPLTQPAQQLLVTPDGRQLYLLSGKQLAVYHQEQQKWVLREQRHWSQPPQHIALLPGGSSLLVQVADGSISSWFDVQTASHLRQLTRIQNFASASQSKGLLFSESQRRVFASLGTDGQFQLFSSQQPQPLLTSKLPDQVQAVSFAPEGNGLLLENDQGWSYYPLRNAYPEISWHSLWQKQWYENYPEPAYIWQSTSGNDDYQSKFSLVPLVFGTLKAAAYGMLFAVPLVLAGAIYSACFMSAGFRRVVKPSIELMGALPTVVIGLIASLWLAPLLERYVAVIILMPWLLAIALLFCAWLVHLLLQRYPRHWQGGRHLLLLLPLMLLALWLTTLLAPWLEQGILGQSLVQWLGPNFAQRNGLVVGIAMGFALIPLMFTLAEDALFSVPAILRQGSLALGATPWQTLVRVVLPSASAGICAALMIGFGRAVGETMILLMASGNAPVIDSSIFQGLRAMAANIAIEMPEAVMDSGHYRVLLLTALVLFLFTFVVNTIAEALRLRLRKRYNTHQDLP